MSLDDDACLIGGPLADGVALNSGAAYFFELQELALSTPSTTVSSGAVAQLATHGGVPGTPCFVTTAVLAAGPLGGLHAARTPVLATGTFNAEGVHVAHVALPSLPSGTTVKFRSFGAYLPQVGGKSNSVLVTVQ